MTRRIMKNLWKEKPIHRIFVFCEHGMQEQLVDNFFRQVESNARILDPFVGSGTVAVESVLRKHAFVGIDANPLAILITRVKMTRIDEDSENYALEVWESGAFEPYLPTTRLKRYHSDKQLAILSRIRGFIEDLTGPIKDLALVTFLKVAEKYSNLRKSPAPKFRKKKVYVTEEEIVRIFFKELRAAINDLRLLPEDISYTLIQGDSSKILADADAVLTSPPFANNIDYIRHTQLQLFWAGFAQDSKDLSRLRDIQIPASEASARKWKEKSEDPLVLKYVARIKSKRKYTTFLLEYFYAMEQHFSLLAKYNIPFAWYTIGDSTFAGKYIPTHELLAHLARKHCFSVEYEKIGERGPNKSLYLLKLTLE